MHPTLPVKVISLKHRPVYKTSLASGADVMALLEQPVVLKRFQRLLVPTGLFVEIPQGFEVQIRSRSGLAAKNGVFVLNEPGTIDADYRGEIKVILSNQGEQDLQINDGDRICQMVLCPVVQMEF